MNAQTLIAWLIRSCAGAVIFALFVALTYAQSSVEKSETTQQTKKQEDELALARAAVAKPNNKTDKPETGRIWGGYSVQSALEFGYRFENTRGNRNSFLSQVNVRDGFRVLEYSLDSRAIDGRGMLYDTLRSEVNNAGGDQSQNFSLRMDKARAYRFDSHVRRFNYFRTPGPNFARDIRNSDLRQQVADYNLRLFPQRAVRFNLGFGRSSAKGRYSPDISFSNDFFQLLGTTRWESNDYRAGMDATYGGWNFSASALHRRFKDDPSVASKSFVDPGILNPTDAASLTSFSRLVPIRSHATVVSDSVQGNIGEPAVFPRHGSFARRSLRPVVGVWTNEFGFHECAVGADESAGFAAGLLLLTFRAFLSGIENLPIRLVLKIKDLSQRGKKCRQNFQHLLREEPTGADFAPVKSPLFSIKPKVGSGTKNARNVSYYIKDLGAPSVTTGTSDTVLALPLRRHNPEARLAYRFNNHLTGNVSYRHFSYNERDFSALDYRSNISTISLRITF